MRSKLLGKRKSLHDDYILTKIPKFRRKLIEKYSTRRYNVNTKLLKVTSLKRRHCDLKIDQSTRRKGPTANADLSNSFGLLQSKTIIVEQTDNFQSNVLSLDTHSSQSEKAHCDSQNDNLKTEEYTAHHSLSNTTSDNSLQSSSQLSEPKPSTDYLNSSESSVQLTHSSLVNNLKQESKIDVPSPSDISCIKDADGSEVSAHVPPIISEHLKSNFESAEDRKLERITCSNDDKPSEEILPSNANPTINSTTDCAQDNVELSKVAVSGEHKSVEDELVKKKNSNEVVLELKSDKNLVPISSHVEQKSPSSVIGVTNQTNSHSKKISTAKIKLVPSKFYSYLSECCNEQKAAVKSVKKRKRLTIGKKKKKNVNSLQEKRVFCDPYSQDWENLNWDRANSSDNTALIVHLGAGRPLYPLIHRNILTLCQRKDTETEISDMWAEFSLSTLVENPEDCRVKPILMPVVDASLSAAIADFKEEWKIDSEEMEITKVVSTQSLSKVEEDLSVEEPTILDQSANRSKTRRKKKKNRWTARPKPKYSLQDWYQVPDDNKKEIDSEKVSPKKTIVENTDKVAYELKPCWVVLKQIELNSSPNLPCPSIEPIPKKSRLQDENQTQAFSNKKVNLEQFHKERVPKLSPTPTSLSSCKLASPDEKLSIPLKNELVSKPKRKIVKPIWKTETVSPKKPNRSPVTTLKRIPKPKSQKEETVHPVIETKTGAVSPKKKILLANLSDPIPMDIKIEPTYRDIIPIEDEGTSFTPAVKEVAVLEQPSLPTCSNVGMLQEKPKEANLSKSLSIANPSLSTFFEKLTELPPQPIEMQPLGPLFDDFDEEWISTEHYFGPKHCARTYGPMLDYLSRNKSLIYFYKIRRILKFQRKNNKYFQSCFYLHVCRSVPEEDSFIDVLGDVDDVEDGEVNINESKTSERKGRMLKSVSSNPLEVMGPPTKMRIFGLAVLRDMDNQNQHHLRFVNSELLQNLTNTKWIILQLHQDVVQIIFNESYEFAARLLFEVMYRADLTKKIVCHTVTQARNDGSLELGVYGIPGLCDAVIIGPCRLPERYNSLQAIIQRPSGEVETVHVAINAVRPESPGIQTSTIRAVWWRPVNLPPEVTSINAAYLSFLFKWQAAAFPSYQAGKLVLSAIQKKHNPESVNRFVGSEGDVNYVLIHSGKRESSEKSTSKLLQLLQSDENEGSVWKKSKRPSTSPYATTDRFVNSATEHSNGRLEYSASRSSQSCNVASARRKDPALRQEHNSKEKLRRQELSMNRAFLNSIVAGDKMVPSSVMALNSVVQEATDAITMLKKKYIDLLKEKESLMKRRKILLSRFITLTQDGDRNIMLMRKLILSQLSLPRYGEAVERETPYYIPSANASDRTTELGQPREVHSRGNHSDIDNVSIQPRRHSGSRRRRRSRKSATATSLEESNSVQPQEVGLPLSKPVRVTVQSGNHIIGLVSGPYTEHNYCNFVDTSSDPPEDPLGDLKSSGNVRNYSYTDTSCTNALQSSTKEKRNDDTINICVTEDGKPVFKLAINRTNESQGNEGKNNTRPEMKKVIQRILQEMKVKLNENESRNENNFSMNHVELLENIISDTRNDRFFSEISPKEFIAKKDLDNVASHDYQLARSTFNEKKQENGADCEIKVNESHSLFGGAKREIRPGKLISINSLIDKSLATMGKNDEEHSFCISSHYDIEDDSLVPETELEKSVVEEQYVENSLATKSTIALPKPTIQILPSQSELPKLPTRVLHTIPILRKVQGQPPLRKHVPIILGKRTSILTNLKKPYKIIVPRKNLAHLSSFQSEKFRIRCPSFVPVTKVGENITTDKSQVSSTPSALPNDVINLLDVEENSPAAEEEASNSVKSVAKPDALAAENIENLVIEETPLSPGVEIVGDDGNVVDLNCSTTSSTESETPFRLSVKPFASLNVFKNDVSTNVDKLLKF